MSSPGDECQECYRSTYHYNDLDLCYKNGEYVCGDCLKERYNRTKNNKKQMLFKLLEILQNDRPQSFEQLYELLFDDDDDDDD